MGGSGWRWLAAWLLGAGPALGGELRNAEVDPALGLPPVAFSVDVPAAQIALGRKLFMDRRLSRNDTMSCGMCHIPEQGFASVELATAVGIEGRSLRRNAPSVLNVGFVTHLFHDGRETRLEEQLWGPLLAADEMGNPSPAAVVQRVAGLADYAGVFEQAFGGEGPSAPGIARALAAYQRSLASGGSRFDRWRFAGDAGALSSEERAGFGLFAGKAGCTACHTIDRTHALFSDQRFHNTGIGWAKAYQPASEVRVPLAPGVETQVSSALLERLFGGTPRDEGRFEVTRREADRFAYRTPTLRNAALSAPYMHDGSLATLEAVIDFYDQGGIDNPGKDPSLAPLGLSRVEKKMLIAFLRSLTGANVEQLAAEARASASAPSIEGRNHPPPSRLTPSHPKPSP